MTRVGHNQSTPTIPVTKLYTCVIHRCKGIYTSYQIQKTEMKNIKVEKSYDHLGSVKKHQVGNQHRQKYQNENFTLNLAFQNFFEF